MTVVPPKVVPPKVAPKKPSAALEARKTPPPAVKKPAKRKRGFFFSSEPINVDFVPNEEAESERYNRIHNLLHWQTIILAVLMVLFILVQPILKPIYHYYARDPDGNVMTLSALTMPNVTDRALISWSVTSVTEIMTFGFGDIVDQLGRQKARFTQTGWDSFVAAYRKQRINETFKENQLVLTTVPSDTAVILAQGLNESGVYQWLVQVPVIMTYATNNNVTQPHRGVISLTITRVSPQQNPSGIAIRKWTMDR